MSSHRSKFAGLLATALSLSAAVAVTTASPAAAAPTDVVINEMMFHALSDLDGDDYLELYNRGTDPVDLSGWTFSGITLTLPAGTTIPAGGYLVVAKDAVQFQATYGFAPAAVYGGNLSNSGETVALRDATAATIDTVSFLDVDPWPVKADGTGPSLELIDATLENNDSLNWAAATNASGRTPGRRQLRTPHRPRPPRHQRRRRPRHQPRRQPARHRQRDHHRPDHGRAALPHRLQRRADPDHDGRRRTRHLHRHHPRHRPPATSSATASRPPTPTPPPASPASTTPSSTAASSCPAGSPARSPSGSGSSRPPTTPRWSTTRRQEIIRYGAIAYDGAVYDNVEMEIKGHASQNDPKVSWKFKTPSGYDFDMPGLFVEPVDEIDMQADWSDRSHGRAILSWDAYKRAGFEDHTMFTVRTQRNGAFQGVYNLQETYDGTWREREGYDDNQFFEAETSAFSTRPINVQFSKKAPDETDFAPIAAFVNGVRLTGTAQRDYLLGNADLPQMINYAAVTAIIEHHDSSSKNFYMSQDPVTGRWSIIPWDLDHTLGNGCCNVDSNFVTPAEPGDNTSALMRAILAQPQWRDMYFRRLRTLVNDLLATGRMEALYDARVGPAQPVATLDYSAWPYPGNPVNYATFRQRLFNDITARRTAFANDARVPGNQPAAPDIVIDEIQHSPTGGNTAEFVELYNPGSPGHRPLRLDHLRRDRPHRPARHRDPAPLGDDLRQQRPRFPRRLRPHRVRRRPLHRRPRRQRGPHPDPPRQLRRRHAHLRRRRLAGPHQRPVPRAAPTSPPTTTTAPTGALSTGSGTPGRHHRWPRHHRPRRPDHRHRHRRQRLATVRWTAPTDDGGSGITGYSDPGPRQHRDPGRGTPHRRRRRHQPGRHRPDQRHRLPLPGRRHQHRRHRRLLRLLQHRHPGRHHRPRSRRSSGPPARAPPAAH